MLRMMTDSQGAASLAIACDKCGAILSEGQGMVAWDSKRSDLVHRKGFKVSAVFFGCKGRCLETICAFNDLESTLEIGCSLSLLAMNSPFVITKDNPFEGLG